MANDIIIRMTEAQAKQLRTQLESDRIGEDESMRQLRIALAAAETGNPNDRILRGAGAIHINLQPRRFEIFTEWKCGERLESVCFVDAYDEEEAKLVATRRGACAGCGNDPSYIGLVAKEQF